MSDIEPNLWKNNIKYGERKRQDYLDISEEDFSQHLITNNQGMQVNPSTFNIFRDSLRHTAAQLHEKLLISLPDMNLDAIDSQSSNSDTDNENEVVPLDFRTALMAVENKIVIQAKPLHFNTVEEDLRDMEMAEKLGKGGIDDYLDSVRKEPFA